jgi:hypothetical protein
MGLRADLDPHLDTDTICQAVYRWMGSCWATGEGDMDGR